MVWMREWDSICFGTPRTCGQGGGCCPRFLQRRKGQDQSILATGVYSSTFPGKLNYKSHPKIGHHDVGTSYIWEFNVSARVGTTYRVPATLMRLRRPFSLKTTTRGCPANVWWRRELPRAKMRTLSSKPGLTQCLLV